MLKRFSASLNALARSCERAAALTAVFGLLAAGCARGSESQGEESIDTVEQAITHGFETRAESCGDHDHAEPPGARKAAAKRVHWRSRHHRPKGSVKVKVLGINDFHGQLSSGRQVNSRPVGGAAVLGAYLKAETEGFERASLIIHAGDQVGASPPASALLQDEPSITFLNMLANRHCSRRELLDPRCNLVGTLGNHEFDEGTDEMLRLIRGGNHELGPFLEDPYRGARFPYVSANVVEEQSGQPILPPFVIKRVGAVKVGVIGAVLKETPTIVTPTGVAGLSFLDEATAINRQVKRLRKRGIRAVIVTIHQGGRQDSFEGPTIEGGEVTGPIMDIVSQLDDEVDLVVSGHTHSFTNALLENQNGTPILVTQAFSASTAFDRIELSIDRKSGDVTEKSAEIVTTYADVSPGDAPDPEIAALVLQAEELTAPLANQVVAESADAISRTQNDAGESALGNLIADAQRAQMGTDFAFMNPGGIRADLDAGEVTWGELFTIQPFGNSLIGLTLTGAQVIDLLEQQWLDQPFPRILQISGLEYTWDEALPEGSRIVEVLKDGEPLDPNALYTVTVNSFMAAGGDNFTVLTQGTDPIGGPVDLDALIDYVAELSQPFSAAIEGRITRLN